MTARRWTDRLGVERDHRNQGERGTRVPSRVFSGRSKLIEGKVAMHVMVVHHTPSLTQERYETVVRGLTGGKSRLQSPADIPTPGLLVHVAAETDDGFLIFDVFESQEMFDKFRAIAGPIATEAGVEEPPKAFPLHTYISV